ncbi:putative ABC transport system permease protein [Catenulispora sp. GAS73]|uniref:ABC transporter permease n=1 Tax=Catenulispora sp. GAS73 TaxID=3156269 RepID=UPI0035160B8B
MIAAWQLPLRIARREAWRNKRRSLLVAAMIALPVAGAVAADTLWRSAEVTTQEQAVRDMGRYDARISAVSGSALYQSPDGANSVPALASGKGGPGSAADLAALLPAGSRVAGPYTRYSLQALVTLGDGRTWAGIQEGDPGDPLQAGILTRHSGSAPSGDDQVAISSALARHLGKGAGDSIEVRVQSGDGSAPPSAPMTVHVTGVYDSVAAPYDSTIFAPHAVFSSVSAAITATTTSLTTTTSPTTTPSTANQSSSPSYFVRVPGGVSWDLVRQLNEHGFTAESKKVLADPPPPSQVLFYSLGLPMAGPSGSNAADLFAMAVTGVTIVLLEVVLLAGPAFAVGARRRRRDFGLLATAGADGRQLRRVVLADGVVLGLVGGFVGLALGLAGAAIGFPYLDRATHQAPGGFRLAPLELLAAFAVGVVTGVIAAVAPAVSTARQDVVVALTGRRGQSAPHWKLPILGLAGTAIGSALILWGAFAEGHSSYPVTVGLVVAELGVVACTPILVTWSGRFGRLLPLSGRLALRDGARNRGRTAPAVAAVLAAVAGASTVAMVISSDSAKARAEYSSELRSGEAALSLNPQAGVDPARLGAQIAGLLPTRRYAVVQGVTDRPGVDNGYILAPALVSDGLIPGARLGEPVPDRHYERGDAGCCTVGGPELLRTMLGYEDPVAENVLSRGGVVVFGRPDAAHSGPNPTVVVGLDQVCVASRVDTVGGIPAINGPMNCTQPPNQLTLPAAYVSAPRQRTNAVIAPAPLDELGVYYRPSALLFDDARMPTAAQEQKASDLAAGDGISYPFYVERGYQDHTYLGLLALAGVAGVVMLGASAVATGLAITDAQADLETLAAIGARARVRRKLAASQAAVTAGLGALLGAAFGLLPAIGIIEVGARGAYGAPRMGSSHQVYLSVPWLFLALVIVALPLLAAAGAAVLTRSRIDLRRRRLLG